MDKPKYTIGDVVFVGEWKLYLKNEICPDCGGTKKFKVTLFDETEYLVDCERCKDGYRDSTGYVSQRNYQASVFETVIQGVELACWSNTEKHWVYQVGSESESCRSKLKETDIFNEEQAALAYAINKGRQMEIDESASMFLKEKPERTWAWHVTYHRRAIRQAQKELDYHSRKLSIANEKVKEQKKTNGK